MDKALLSLLKASLGLEKSIKDLVKFYNEQNEIITDITNITSHGQGEWHSGTLHTTTWSSAKDWLPFSKPWGGEGVQSDEK